MTRYPVFVSLLVTFGWLFGPQSAGAFPAAEEPGEAAGGETMTRAEWKREIRGWLERLRASHRTGDNLADDLKERIRNIRDSNALDALKVALADGSDYPRIVFLEPLALIGGRDAFRTRVDVSVTDGNVLVRKAAAEWLDKMGNAKDAIPQYVKYLRAPRYRISAAEAVSASGLTRELSSGEAPDPALANALIKALTVETTRVAPAEYWHYTPLVGPGGTGYVYRERRVYARVRVPLLNASSLKALTEYSGEDYGYDQAAWKNWYQRKKNLTQDKN
jgi:hypothetical protein